MSSLLSFTPEVTYGGRGCLPRGRLLNKHGYAFIETTEPLLCGRADRYAGWRVPLHSDPLVIPVGNGTKTYGSCRDAMYLDTVYKTSEHKVKGSYLHDIDSMKVEMDRYYANRDANNYNLRVPLYNDLQNKRLKLCRTPQLYSRSQV